MKPGRIVAGRFRIVARAGAGTMGTVHRAIDERTGALVALKTLRSETEADDAHGRFAHEVRVLGELDHPGVVRYVAHGSTEEGEPFLAMEWIEGAPLSALLRSVPPLTFDETLSLGVALAEALAACHARGVVHRDLKPGNVMIGGRDVAGAKIVDFGLARIASTATLTASGTRLGTPRFMAPEQIRDAKRVDGRADVFSLGCILFECVTGRAAFRGDDAMGVMVKILLERAPRVRDVCPTVPAPLSRAIDAALEPHPEERPTAEALARALREIDLEGEGPQSTPYEGASLARPTSTTPSLAADPVEAAEVVETLRETLPKPSGAFVGRADLLSRIERTLERERAVTLSLWGPPGIGKTRVAIEAVRRATLRDRAMAAVFCDLRDARTRGDLARAVARALTVDPGRGVDDAEENVARALRARVRPVLLLDAVDHLAPELASFREALRRRAPAVRVLLTSRERLELEDVDRIEVGPLEEGAALFCERARAVLGSSAELDGDAVEAVVSAVSAIPLAIELAAARVDVLGIEELAAQLRRRAEDASAPLDVAMREAIAWSYAQLDPSLAQALARCAIFPSPFSMDAACAVVATDDAADRVARLRGKALLAVEPADGSRETRLVMLSPIRAFALQQLDAKARRDSLERHAVHHAARGAELVAELDRTFGLAAQRALSRDEAHFALSFEHSLSSEPPSHERAVTLICALEAPLTARGATDRLITLIERVLAAHERAALPLAALVRLHRVRARAFGSRGRAADAVADLERVIERVRDAARPSLLGGALLELAVLHHARGALDAAQSAYREAIELLAEAGVDRDEARALGNLGALLHDQGELDQAREHYREAIALLRAVGDLRLHGIFLGNLALLEQERGARVEARAHYDEAVRELEAYRDARLLGVTLGNLAALDLEEARAEPALRRLERAYALLSTTGDARSLALCGARLGAALACVGRLDEAEARVARAERLVARRDPISSAAVHLQRCFIDLERARVAAEQGDSDAVRRLADAIETRVRGAESVSARSDDVRTALRTLAPRVAALRDQGTAGRT